jgi:transposase InsO family protein
MEAKKAPQIIKPTIVTTKPPQIIRPTIVNTKEKLTEEQARNIANELHRPIKHKYQRRKVEVHSLDSIWAADLCEMKNENGYHYILTVVDLWSKFAWGIPLKAKDGRTVKSALEQIINDSNRSPQLLWTDKGKEFYNSTFKSYLNENGIKLYSTESELKSTPIERLNRTLKEKMEKEFTVNNLLGRESNWLTILEKIVEKYNNTVHSKTKLTPVDASKDEYQALVAEQMYDNNNNNNNEVKQKAKFKVGDRVRIYKYKYQFEKGYTTRFTNEIFVISAVHDTNPITFSLKDLKGEDIIGKFYKEELQKSEVK